MFSKFTDCRSKNYCQMISFIGTFKRFLTTVFWLEDGKNFTQHPLTYASQRQQFIMSGQIYNVHSSRLWLVKTRFTIIWLLAVLEYGFIFSSSVATRFKIVRVRNSSQGCYIKKVFLKIFAKFTGKHLCRCLFWNKVTGLTSVTLSKKRLWHRHFPVNFAKIFKNAFLTEHLWKTASWEFLCWSRNYGQGELFPEICQIILGKPQ